MLTVLAAVAGLAAILTAVLVFVLFVFAAPILEMAREALPLVPTVPVAR